MTPKYPNMKRELFNSLKKVFFTTLFFSFMKGNKESFFNTKTDIQKGNICNTANFYKEEESKNKKESIFLLMQENQALWI